MMNGSQQSASNITPSGAGQSSNSAGIGNSSTPGLSRFDTLEQTLEMFVENARHLCVIVSDFSGQGGGGSVGLSTSASSPALPTFASSGSSSSSNNASSQAVLNQKLQTLVSGLQELDHVKHHFQDVKIPLELFDNFVDTGRNPQMYTKECMERTLKKNKEINGKIEIYKKFRANLLKELSEEFPKETMQYRAIREQAPSTSTSSANGANVKYEQ